MVKSGISTAWIADRKATSAMTMFPQTRSSRRITPIAMPTMTASLRGRNWGHARSTIHRHPRGP